MLLVLTYLWIKIVITRLKYEIVNLDLFDEGKVKVVLYNSLI